MPNIGFNRHISVLTAIRPKILEQKFFEISIADYIPIVVGEDAWSDSILFQNSIYTGSDFEQSLVGYSASDQLLATSNVGLVSQTVPVMPFANTTGWTIHELNTYARGTGNSLLEQKSKSQKKVWDLGIQKVAFIGLLSNPNVTGLLNNPFVTNDTVTIPKKISAMTAKEFNTFLKSVLAKYYQNSGSTDASPNRFVIPMSDYLGLVEPYSESESKARITLMYDAFKMATGRKDFEIKGVAYGDSNNNGLGVNRYVMYNTNDETLQMDIPVPFQFLAPETSNNFSMNQVAVGQFTGVTVRRPQQVLYFSH